MNMAVVCTSTASEEKAGAFCLRHGYCLSYSGGDASIALVFSDKGVSLESRERKNPLVVQVDFVSGSVAHRRQFGGGKGQMIAKAVGLAKGFVPHVLDATAGLGRDAFVLASLGGRVSMLERSPIVHALLEDGLARAKRHAQEEGDVALESILARMTLLNIDSGDFLTQASDPFDVVYLDPMFPERKKSAQVKKEMRVFHAAVGADEDADNLLPLALERATYRVVVKRPRIAPDLAQQKPNFRLEGKSSRFDVYTKKAFPL